MLAAYLTSDRNDCMTFSEAILNLPTCAYAVHSSVSLGDRVVEVWFMHPVPSATENGQDTDSRPLFRVEDSYARTGKLVSGPSKQVCVGAVPAHIRRSDWCSSPIDRRNFPVGEGVDVILHVLRGISREEATSASLWPREMRMALK